MGSLELVFAKTPAQEQMLSQMLLDQRDPKSAQYHHWLTPAQYGQRFGAGDATVAALAKWLESNGFEVGELPAGRGHLAFFGSKAQVESAFHTRIHLFDLNGERHFANVSNPMIPAAFTSRVTAIRGLNDFYPTAGVKSQARISRAVLPALAGKSTRGSTSPDTYYPGSDQYPGYVGPTDFATMYNLLPAYQQGITGAGVTVAVAAQSDIDPSVLATFWAAFGVAGAKFGLPAQQVSSIPVPVGAGGVDPGQTSDGNEDEAYLDTEIVGALAPGAKIMLVRDKNATIAAEYVIDQNLAAVLNLSFGSCEGAEAAANSAINSLWEQGVSQGITITVSSADAGAAACTAEADIGETNDVNSNGFAVNGLASTPYNLAVGGTDFDPRVETQGYWSATNQAGTLESAVSHIPEMAWNDSCGNPVIASYFGISDPLVFCNTAHLGSGSVANPYIDILGGGGGLSSCTTVDGSGNCSGGYAQPGWQQGVLGIGSFGARALPDVAMISTRWLVCSYDTAPCDPTQPPTFPPAATGTIKVLEGTSAAAPSLAAIVALIDQTQISSTQSDGRQGLVNTTFYSLAAQEYASAATVTACNASQGQITNPACIFYDVTAGSNAQPCSVANYATNSAGSLPASDCTYGAGDSTGIMEVAGTQDYAAGAGFDLATGLGSINAAALIAAFQAASAPTGLSAIASGQTVTLTWAADSNATEGYDIYQGTAPGAVSSTPVQRNVTGTTTKVTGLEFAQSYVFAVAAVSANAVSPASSQVEVTTVPAAPTGLNAIASGAGSLNLTWTASGNGTYDIFEAASSGGEGTTPLLSGWAGTSLTLSALTPGKQYFFTVAAIGAGGDSAQSAQATGTVLPTAPTGLHATGGNGSVSLTWTAGAGAASYNVYEGTSSAGVASQPALTGVVGTSASVSGLNNGTTYYFTVAAVNAGGDSSSSAEADATPVAPKGGGGSLDWLGLGILGCMAIARGIPKPAGATS